jgi:hypothetical protein
MSPPLVTRSTGDIIPASDHNDILPYIETGQYRVLTKYLALDAQTLPSGGTATDGWIAYDKSVYQLKYTNNGGSVWNTIGNSLGKYQTTFTGQTSVVVNHNLNDLYPSVTVIDDANNIVIPDSITINSANQVTVTFNTSTTGAVTIHAGGSSIVVNNSGGLANYTTTFVSQTSVTVTHNLNDLYPVVLVFDSSNNVIMPDVINVASNNTVTLTFATATTGKVVVQGGIFAGALNSGNILPTVDSTYNLGSGTYEWQAVYANNLTLTQATGQAVLISRSGTGTITCFEIDINGAADPQAGLGIFHSGTGWAATVGDGSGNISVRLGEGSASTDKRCAYIVRNIATTGLGPVVNIIQDHASNDGNVLQLRQDGNGYALRAETTYDSNASFAGRFEDTSQGANTSYVWFCRSGNTQREVMQLYRNLPAANTGSPVFALAQNHASDDQDAMYISNAGTGKGINLLQTGGANAIASSINNNNAWSAGYFTDSSGYGTNVVNLATTGDSDRRTLFVQRNVGSSNTGGYVVYIQNQGASSTDDQGCINVVHAGAAAGNNSYSVYITNSCNQNCLNLNDATSTWGNFSTTIGSTVCSISRSGMTWLPARFIQFMNSNGRLNDNGLTVTETGMSYVAGKTGMSTCASFNGTTAKLVYAADAWYANSWGVSYWFNTNSFATFKRIVSIQPTSGNINRICIGHTDTSYTNKLYIEVYGSDGTSYKQYVGSTTLSTSTWYHAAFSYDGTTLKMFLNGVEETPNKLNDNAVTQTATSRVLKLGTEYAESTFYNGLLDDVRFWSTHLSVNNELNLVYQNGGGTKFIGNGNTPLLNLYNNAGINSNTPMLQMFQYAPNGSSSWGFALGVDTINISSIANASMTRNCNTVGLLAGPIMMINNSNTSDNKSCLVLYHQSSVGGAPLELTQTNASGHVIWFNSCTDKGTGHTVIGGSIQINLNGSTKYINVYN